MFHASFGRPRGDYTLVTFEGGLDVRPRPSNELAAVLLLPDDCLLHFSRTPALSLGEPLASGGELYVQDGIELGALRCRSTPLVTANSPLPLASLCRHGP